VPLRDTWAKIEKKEAAAPAAKPAKAKAAAEAAPAGLALIGIEDFSKLALRTAKVIAAERVPDADRLLRLQIDLGTEKRQIVAGIALFYTPEQVVGKTIVVVTNLQPAVIRGVESNGMLLAAKTKKDLRLITVDGDLPPGAPIG
jgi:methionyl-tRNA synthetase